MMGNSLEINQLKLYILELIPRETHVNPTHNQWEHFNLENLWRAPMENLSKFYIKIHNMSFCAKPILCSFLHCTSSCFSLTGPVPDFLHFTVRISLVLSVDFFVALFYLVWWHKTSKCTNMKDGCYQSLKLAEALTALKSDRLAFVIRIMIYGASSQLDSVINRCLLPAC